MDTLDLGYYLEAYSENAEIFTEGTIVDKIKAVIAAIIELFRKFIEAGKKIFNKFIGLFNKRKKQDEVLIEKVKDAKKNHDTGRKDSTSNNQKAISSKNSDVKQIGMSNLPAVKSNNRSNTQNKISSNERLGIEQNDYHAPVVDWVEISNSNRAKAMSNRGMNAISVSGVYARIKSIKYKGVEPKKVAKDFTELHDDYIEFDELELIADYGLSNKNIKKRKVTECGSVENIADKLLLVDALTAKVSKDYLDKDIKQCEAYIKVYANMMKNVADMNTNPEFEHTDAESKFMYYACARNAFSLYIKSLNEYLKCMQGLITKERGIYVKALMAYYEYYNY